MEGLGAAVRLYRGVTAAMLRSVLAEESRLDLAAVKAGGLHLARRVTLLEARSRERAIRSATRSLVSGHLLLVGLQYGLSLVHGNSTPAHVEQGARNLIELFAPGGDWWEARRA